MHELLDITEIKHHVETTGIRTERYKKGYTRTLIQKVKEWKIKINNYKLNW